jgi:hypothetical protein
MEPGNGLKALSPLAGGGNRWRVEEQSVERVRRSSGKALKR